MAEYLTEREEARERLKKSVDALTEQASLQVNLQKEPLKMLGGASAVGAVLGLVIGRQFRRSRKIYVDSQSPAKHQKALVKAQKSQKGGGVGGALVATLGTLAVKTVMDKVVTPRLEGLADNLLDRAGESRPPATLPRTTAAQTVSVPAATPDASQASVPVTPGTTPVSRVEAKAQGSVISTDDLLNPNRR